MFINRHQELAALDRMFRSETAELFVLYGRRRVGKTELLLPVLFLPKKNLLLTASSMVFLPILTDSHDIR